MAVAQDQLGGAFHAGEPRLATVLPRVGSCRLNGYGLVVLVSSPLDALVKVDEPVDGEI